MLRIFLPAGLLLLSTLRLVAQNDPNAQSKPPLQLAGYQWEHNAREQKLTEQQIATLKKQGFVVTDKTYRQVFTPYLDKTQLFITSDSLINGYAVLLEDSIFRLERRNARRLETFLREAWNGVQEIEKGNTGDEALLEAASDRAKIVIGVAYSLASGEKITEPPALARIIDEETQRVQAATGQIKPDWLGAPDPGFVTIDYTRFRPRGFYAESPSMQRYFQATAWLQAIPFRFDKDEEFAAYLLLYRMLRETEDKKLSQAFRSIEIMKYGFHLLVGKSDGEDLEGDRGYSWPDTPWNAELLASLRKIFQENNAPDAEINDQIAFPAANGKPERTLRLLAAHRVPDALLFARTERARHGNLPSGLEIAAALDSPKARKILEESNAGLLRQIESEKEELSAETIYYKFLDALSVLLRPVDHSAPALFHSPAWEEKSLQTFLGGWVQARHAWVLQAKQNYTMMGMTMAVPSCFAEPVPDFYNAMGQLAAETARVFESVGAYSNRTDAAVEQLRASARAGQRHVESLKSNPNARPGKDDANLVAQGEMMLMMIDGVGEHLSRQDNLSKVVSALDNLADRLEKGDFGENPGVEMALIHYFPAPQSRWNRFMQLCFKLEALSQRQLKGAALSQADEELAETFGEELAGIMFYEGNSYDDPFDDVPRIVDIATNANASQVLHAGIGRPRQIYVLYPYGGKEILTHGAVFPYYEFPNATRLTDKEWIDLLSSPKAPAPPDWLKQANGPH